MIVPVKGETAVEGLACVYKQWEGVDSGCESKIELTEFANSADVEWKTEGRIRANPRVGAEQLGKMAVLRVQGGSRKRAWFGTRKIWDAE